MNEKIKILFPFLGIVGGIMNAIQMWDGTFNQGFMGWIVATMLFCCDFGSKLTD